tara:strand:+ start:17201 stop:17749 length:549 start_codon:yes stop_codon:yes gene_type:complete
MANYRLTDKTVLANNPASDDVLMVVDVSDLSSSAQGTSKQYVAEYMVATEKVTVDNAEFLLLNTTGKTLVTNKGANKVIIPLSVYCEYTEGATPNTATVTPTFGFVDQSSLYYWDQQRFGFDSPLYNGKSWLFNGGNPSAKGTNAVSSLSDLAFKLWFTGTPTPLATGTINIWTTYRLIDIS